VRSLMYAPKDTMRTSHIRLSQCGQIGLSASTATELKAMSVWGMADPLKTGTGPKDEYTTAKINVSVGNLTNQPGRAESRFIGAMLRLAVVRS
jgi:hypothetical protein